MKDFMSGGLSRVGSRAQSTFNRMSQHVNQVTQRNRVLGQSFEQLQTRIRTVEGVMRSSTIPAQIAAARRELEALQRQASRHPGNLGGSGGSGGVSSVSGIAMGAMLGNIGANIASEFLNVVKDGIGGAISGAMEKEKGITGLGTFIGDEKAKVAYQGIRHDAEISSYDTGTLLKANRALISVDGNAENAREDVMNLANAVSGAAGGNDELQRMAINMQQIKSLGKASAMDIKQFGYAGINIYKLLQKATGKNADEVKEMDVTYDLLTKSLAVARMEGGLYAGALERMNQTMSGKWESLKDRTGNALTDIGDAFTPVITKVLELGISLTEGVGPFLERMKPNILQISSILSGMIDTGLAFFSWLTGSSTSVQVFTTVVGALTAAFLGYQLVMKAQALWTGIVTVAQNLLNIAMTMNPIGLVVAGIAALIAAFVIAYKKFDTFRAIVDGTWSALKTLGVNIKNTFLKIPELVIESFKRIPQAIADVFSGVGDLFSAIFNGDFSKIGGIIKKIGGNIVAANPLTAPLAALGDEMTKGVGDAFMNGFDKSLDESKKQKALDAKAQATKKKEDPTSYFSDLTRFKNTTAKGDDEKEKNKKKSKDAGDTIAGGGTKYITIHLGKFFDNIQFTTMNMTESSQEIEKILLECMGRVLYNGGKNM
ncbi:hypothetical protein DBR39_13765 [Chryseobacterium sp. KBW03]|nr:hypothetical protein DBR39_13765 [Chryseobacterium sp. KBW03]